LAVEALRVLGETSAQREGEAQPIEALWQECAGAVVEREVEA
jgi:hypothetical protein